MSTLAAKLDRFVRWFFNVSPTTMEIEPVPPRRRAGTASRNSRAASPTDRRGARTSGARGKAGSHSPQAARSNSQEGA